MGDSEAAETREPDATISITVEGPNEFTVRVGERYHDKLMWGEMLGQIAELTHPRIDKVRFWMLTDEEWSERRWRTDRRQNMEFDRAEQ